MVTSWSVRPVVLGLLLAVAACAGPVGFQNAADRAGALSALRTGQAQLGCPANSNCLFTWAVTRPAAQRLLAAQRWDDLADVVLAANFDQDLAWFYLGLAASGLGYNDAARVYFNRSIQRSVIGGLQTCAPNLCDGVNLPADAQVVLANLPGPATGQVAGGPRRRTAPVRRRVPAAQARGAPAAGPGEAGWVAPVED